MRFWFLLAALLLSSAWAMQEVVAPRVRVIFGDVALEPYAQRVAFAAERALDVLMPLFEVENFTVVVTLDDATDVYNAFAPPLPRPKVVLRALFPTDVSLGYRAADPLYLILVHELTHSLQLSYTERPAGAPALPRLGLVGETVARVPPMWFLEGIATWAESEFTAGGRQDDALTRGLLAAMALGEGFPSLADVALHTYSAWPGGAARYLHGAAFTAHLIEAHGFEVLLAALREFNAGGALGDFAAAWRALGVDLEAEWDTWLTDLRREAEARAADQHAGERLTERGWYTRAPAVSPDGTRLAYVTTPAQIVVAEVTEEGLGEPRTVVRDRSPNKLEWLDDGTLVYARVRPWLGAAWSELFALDVASGRERQLTSGARAHHPAAAPDGCVLYVRDTATEGSQLMRWCEGGVDTLWTAPEGTHLLGVAVSAEGRVALSLWRAGTTELALWERGDIVTLTRSAAQQLEPAWQGETTLLFRADFDEATFDLYALDVERREVRRLTRTVGGAFSPHDGAGRVWYSELYAGGFDIAHLQELQGEDAFAAPLEPLAEIEPLAARYPVRAYSPWPSLVPYGWLPGDISLGQGGFQPAVAATLFGQDDSGRHSYELTLGYDAALQGPLQGAYGHARYRYGANPLLGAFVGGSPLTLGVQAGLWPHQGHLSPRRELALGARGELTLTAPLDLWTSQVRASLGPVYLASAGRWQLDGWVDGVLTQQRRDVFGYATRGPRLAVTAVWSATPEGPSPGAWLDASYHEPLPVGVLELALRAGYRPFPSVPVWPEADWAAYGTLGYRASFPLAWRYGDGLYALERVTLEPRARLWWDGQVSLGGDVSIAADSVVQYGATVSPSVTVGYARGFWTRLDVRLPL